MGNPFSIQVADVMPGLNAAYEGFRTGAEAKIATVKELELESKKAELGELFKTGTPEEIGVFLIDNEELAKSYDIASGVTDTAKIKERTDRAWDGLTGDPVAPLIAKAERQTERGDKEGAAKTLALIQKAQANPKEALKVHYATLAQYQPKELKEYMESQATDTPGAQKEGPTTSEDRYAREKMKTWNVANKDATPAQQAEAKANFMFEYNRKQAPEVTATTEAKEKAEVKFAQDKAYETATGKALAEIEYATETIHAKGDLTPQEKKAKAKRSVTNKLATMAGYYAELDDMTAIVNLDNTTMDNLWASLQSSGLGQYVGQRMGAKPQSIRNAIQSMKPQLMNDMRQATEMGARGLDSEKELEFYLQAMTNESKDMQSNIAAMIVLDEAYGDGKIASELKKMNVSPKYIEEIKQGGLLRLNGALLTDTERAKRIKAGRSEMTSVIQPQFQQRAKPTRQALEYLKANPQFKDQFEAKFGPVPEGL